MLLIVVLLRGLCFMVYFAGVGCWYLWWTVVFGWWLVWYGFWVCCMVGGRFDLDLLCLQLLVWLVVVALCLL